jgi:two-component system, NarL family, nitrate/nitrite response regulator NarL
VSIRVILADDHPFLRAGVEQALSGSGFEIVASVATGAEALAAVARHDPEIAILDVSMPEGTGVEVLRAMRARDDNRPVVILTANLEDSALLAVLAEGADGIVMKDDGVDDLVACLTVVHAGERHIPPGLVERARLIRAARANSPFKRLNPREAELAWMVAQGLRNRDIGGRLELSEGAVKFALHSVFKKLEVTTRTELALLLQRFGYD